MFLGLKHVPTGGLVAAKGNRDSTVHKPGRGHLGRAVHAGVTRTGTVTARAPCGAPAKRLPGQNGREQRQTHTEGQTTTPRSWSSRCAADVRKVPDSGTLKGREVPRPCHKIDRGNIAVKPAENNWHNLHFLFLRKATGILRDKVALCLPPTWAVTRGRGDTLCRAGLGLVLPPHARED